MYTMKTSALAMIIALLMGIGPVYGWNDDTYKTGDLQIEVLKTDCKIPDATFVDVRITNQSINQLDGVYLVCQAVSWGRVIDFTSIYFSGRTTLMPYKSIDKKIILNTGCSRYQTLQFQVKRMR